jgi:16S rRNA pseudouridine516 synthase
MYIITQLGGTMRVDKFLSSMKFCTRKQAKSFLETHEFIVDNKRIYAQNHSFDPNTEKVYIDQMYIYYEFPIHLMLNKPKGYVSANKDEMFPCVTDLIKEPYHRFDFSIAGRLDVDTEGLLILTTDGKFLHEITHPNYHLPKVYEAHLDQPFHHETELLEGVSILDGKQNAYIAKALEIKTHEHIVYITIDEGKFHQVKRMFSSVGYKVIYLKRIKIGKLSLGDLKLGECQKIERRDLVD